MEYIHRSITSTILTCLQPNKVVVLLGSRRTGKTILLNKILELTKEKFLLLNGEDFTTQDIFRQRTIENFKTVFGSANILAIDEAQEIKEIGKALKLIVDHIPQIKIIVTGSSAFDISNKLGEPLTGRKTTFILFPFAQMELSGNETIVETKSRLNTKLIFGSYPEIFQKQDYSQKATYLKELVGSYLMKDILSFEGIKNSDKIIDLLRLISFQIGKEVSLHELGRQLGMHKNTVDKYLDLLSKTFIIFGISGFNRNLRKEISKSKRWYFYDNGIRNILINNLNEIHIRNDVGELWENYIISERIKFQHYTGMISSNYFWRTYQQQEIDWIEERGGNLYAYEMKWNFNKNVRIPSAWKSAYKDSFFEVIQPNNYLNWIVPQNFD
ncbi:MAG: ATP-binding protein [Prolixibacteraceae bacterium]|nr:ATP-binding protein [Prolixibacteraceae bacterium]